MKKFLGIILAASFVFIAAFGLGNVASDWHDNGHNCSLVTISGPACQTTNNNFLSLVSWYPPSVTVVLAYALLVAMVLFYYAALTPCFYRQRFRRWLSLLERRADRDILLTA